MIAQLCTQTDVQSSQSNSCSDTNSLLAFIPNFLAYTASSICQCQVTLSINRSVLAAVKMCGCVVEAGCCLYHLSNLGLRFLPPSPSVQTQWRLPLMKTKTHYLTLCLFDGYQQCSHLTQLQSGEATFIIVRQCEIFLRELWEDFPASRPHRQIIANKWRRTETYIMPLLFVVYEQLNSCATIVIKVFFVFLKIISLSG